ncbi:MAG TPA: VWA domain-containing protein [Polyangiaceae bacterium]
MRRNFDRNRGDGILARIALIVGLVSNSGCDSSASMGATPGGAQDEALATEKIDLGKVPRAEDITVEGKLASHDLPLEGPACTRPLCISSAYAVAPTLDTDKSAVFVQIGFSSGIDAATFHRAPLNLSVVVDRSGSMAGEKIAAVRTALSKLVQQLHEGDRLSIVLFDDRVDVLLPSTPVTDPIAIQALISSISVRGATDMSAGLREGFSQVSRYLGSPGVSNRVIVLTDAIANTGSTDTTSFISQAQAAANNDIGLTVFGVGIDLNQQLVLAISKLRGGNYAYLADRDRISTIFDQDFDYLVTPLAYDMKFRLTPGSGFSVRSVYGFPSWTTASTTVEIDVATVFLSRNRGAIVARLSPTGDVWPLGASPIANLSLSYEPVDEAGSLTDTYDAVYDGQDRLSDTSQVYSQAGVRRTVAYVNSALGEKLACSRYWSGDKTNAIATLDKTEASLTLEAMAIDDSELDVEAMQVARLRNNMQSGYVDNSYRTGDETGDGWPTLGCSLARVPSASSRSRATLLLALMLGGWLAGRKRQAHD